MMELTERTANGGAGGALDVDNAVSNSSSSTPTTSPPYSNGGSSINSKRNMHYKNAHDSDDDTSDMEKLLKGDNGEDDENGDI